MARTQVFDRVALVLSGLCAICLWGCSQSSGNGALTERGSSPVSGNRWEAKLVKVVQGFDGPDSVLVDPSADFVYVSSVGAPWEEYWGYKGKGFISRLKADGEIEFLRWKQDDDVGSAPKGMCVLNGNLYVADIMQVRQFPSGKRLLVVTGETAHLNDVATDGRSIYISDSARGMIYRVQASKEFPAPIFASSAPQGINGITFFKGGMFGVSWDLHEVYDLDPSGQRPPRAFGLAEHFTTLDGIEVLDDGTFIVSDFRGNRVCTISSDRRTVRTLVQLESPGDVGLDRKRGLLFVPEFMKGRVSVFKLQCKE